MFGNILNIFFWVAKHFLTLAVRSCQSISSSLSLLYSHIQSVTLYLYLYLSLPQPLSHTHSFSLALILSISPSHFLHFNVLLFFRMDFADMQNNDLRNKQMNILERMMMSFGDRNDCWTKPGVNLINKFSLKKTRKVLNSFNVWSIQFRSLKYHEQTSLN